MTTKEYLSQSFNLHRLIHAKESRIQDLQDMKERTGRLITGTRVQQNPKRDSMGDLIATLVDLIAEYEADCLELLAVQEEISTVIKTVNREDYQLILFERYVNLKQWEDIAADNDYSEKHVYKLHSAAIKTINLIPNDTPNCGKVSA